MNQYNLSNTQQHLHTYILLKDFDARTLHTDIANFFFFFTDDKQIEF